MVHQVALSDVSRAAWCRGATVSRSLADHPDVSRSTRDRVPFDHEGAWMSPLCLSPNAAHREATERTARFFPTHQGPGGSQ